MRTIKNKVSQVPELFAKSGVDIIFVTSTHIIQVRTLPESGGKIARVTHLSSNPPPYFDVNVRITDTTYNLVRHLALEVAKVWSGMAFNTAYCVVSGNSWASYEVLWEYGMPSKLTPLNGSWSRCR